VLIGVVVLLVATGAAWAQSDNPAAAGKASSSAQSGTSVQGQAQPTTTPQPSDANQPSAGVQAQQETKASVSGEASADPDAALQKVRDRAQKASAKGRALVDKQLKKISADVDANAEAKGKAEAAGRVASEFGMTGDALAAETDQFNAGLGEVIIAHTLMANSKTAITMTQIFALHNEGMGWGQIAQGMNLRLGEVTSAVRSEGNVAQGLAKADGKIAMIHSGGAGAKAGANAGVNAGAHVGHEGAGTAGSVGVGAGVGAKVGK